MGDRSRKRGAEPGNIYERNGVFYARAQVNGQEQRQSLKTRSRKEAERRLAQWLRDLSPYHGTVRNTYDQAAALWIEAGDWKPGTLDRYEQSLKVLEPYFGHLFWDQVDKAALQSFIARRRQAGVSIATINRDLTVISGIAKHVRELPGWPEINPVDLLPKKPRKPKKWVYVRPSAENVDAIFARMHGTFGDLCRVALLTGARKNELVRLTPDDAQGGKLQLWETKSRFRVISVCEEVQEIVARQPSGLSYVFNTRNGLPYVHASEQWREVVKSAQKSAQLEGVPFRRLRFHDLRHEYAIRYLEKGGSLYTLKRLLGHGSVKQTEEYLRYLTPEQADKSVQG